MPWKTIPRRPNIERLTQAKPKLTLVPGNPVLTSGGVSGTSQTLYWPCIINARSILGGSALDTYYLYTSTDHASTAYVRYHTGPTPLGPWTPKGGDLGSGSSMGLGSNETPRVIYVPEDPNGRPFYCYCHSGGGRSQSTQLYSSANGTSGWTRETGLRFMHNPSAEGGLLTPPVADVLEWEGDYHTGYFNPVRIGGRYFSKGLFGGTNFLGIGFWHSRDGKIWHLDPRIGRYQQHVSTDGLAWGVGEMFLWHGSLWAFGGKSTVFASGTGNPTSELTVSAVSWDLRSPETPVQLYTRTQTYETAASRSSGVFVDTDGRCYIYVQYEDVTAGTQYLVGYTLGEAS
jgi:hypothetical protein